jgi:hypothetical protein
MRGAWPDGPDTAAIKRRRAIHVDWARPMERLRGTVNGRAERVGRRAFTFLNRLTRMPVDARDPRNDATGGGGVTSAANQARCKKFRSFSGTRAGRVQKLCGGDHRSAARAISLKSVESVTSRSRQRVTVERVARGSDFSLRLSRSQDSVKTRVESAIRRRMRGQRSTPRQTFRAARGGLVPCAAVRDVLSR